MSFVKSVKDIHLRFVSDLMESSRINSSNVSAIPSFIFLALTFILVHMIIHRRTNLLTHIKVRLYKDLIFHWTFFYITRAWFLLVKGVKYCTTLIEIECGNRSESPCWPNPIVVRGIAFSLLLCLALIPGVLLVIKSVYTQHIPNFLLWVGEDPWLRTEIGISGHYLDRPPPSLESGTLNGKAYHAKRSTSVEVLFKRRSPKRYRRKSKSVEEISRRRVTVVTFQ